MLLKCSRSDTDWVATQYRNLLSSPVNTRPSAAGRLQDRLGSQQLEICLPNSPLVHFSDVVLVQWLHFLREKTSDRARSTAACPSLPRLYSCSIEHWLITEDYKRQ